MQPNKQKIGIYGGSFDPIHFGHLNLAIRLFEIHQLDEVWFCPAGVNPHKLNLPPAAAKHRLEMVRLATQDIPHFRVIDLEIKKQGPSYTVDTLRALQEKFKGNSPKKNYLLLGEDAALDFCSWREPEEIVKLATPLVGTRTKDLKNKIVGDPAICQKLKEGVTPTEIFDISSTDIRKRLAGGLYVGHLVPAKVLDYIYTHKLYF